MAPLPADINPGPWAGPYPGDRKAKASGKEMILEEDRKEGKCVPIIVANVLVEIRFSLSIPGRLEM